MDEFIKPLTEQIRCVKARDGVAHELSDHILDQAKAYEESGTSHDEAVQMAVHEMGDPVEIGVSLDRIHRPQMNWKMILITFVLSMAGLFAIYCQYGESTITGRQCVFTVGGFAVILAVNFIDYSILGRFGHVAYILLTIAFFIGKLLIPYVNGRIPAMSALVYLYVPLFAGVLYQLWGRGYVAVVMDIVIIFATTFFAIVFSNNIVAGANIFFILIFLTITAVRNDMFRVNKRCVSVIFAVIAFLPVAASAVYINSMGLSFKRERIQGFLHPNQYKTTSGYIYTVIREMLGSLRPIGEGSAIDIYEPGYHGYEMIDAIGDLVPLRIMYTYGILAGFFLLFLFVIFIVSAVKIVRSQKNQLGRLVSVSCFLVLFGNFFEGFLMNFGLFPVTTVLIPFITYGGSTVLLYSVLIGLLLSVHRYENVIGVDKSISHPKWRIRVKLERQ